MPSKGFTHPRLPKQYDRLLTDISGLLEQARRTAARSVNAVLTSVYWQIGRRIAEHEQGGKARAEYGKELLMRLSEDLIAMHGRGFSGRNLRQMRAFYLGWEIWQTPSAKFETRVICSSLSSELSPAGPPTPSGQSIFLQTPSAELSPALIRLIRFFRTASTASRHIARRSWGHREEKRRFSGDTRWGGCVPGLAAVARRFPTGGKRRFMAGEISDRPWAEGCALV